MSNKFTERNEQIAKLWNSGKSQRQIATELGLVSRNVVAGAVSRMIKAGVLEYRHPFATPESKPGRKAGTKVPEKIKDPTPKQETLKPDAPKLPKPAPVPVPITKVMRVPKPELDGLRAKPTRGVHFLSLRPHQCHYPYDRLHDGFYCYCGVKTGAAGQQYCGAHAREMFSVRRTG